MTRAISGPPYTPEDHALLAALRQYDASLCPGGCGHPIEVAWHGDMDGWFDADEYVCYACTARDGGRERKFTTVSVGRDFAVKPLPPFDMAAMALKPEDHNSPGPAGGVDATLNGGDS